MQSYNITGLAPYQLVTVTITATNGGGTSGNSNEMTSRTSEAGIVIAKPSLFHLPVFNCV